MHRFPALTLALAVALLAALGPAGSAAAQDATPAEEEHGIVGSWRAAITPAQASPERALATFDADGFVISAAPPVLALPFRSGEPVFTSAGHGMWEATGPDTAIFTFVVLLSDGQGNAFGTNTVQGNLTVGDDGQTLSGEFVWNIADTMGNTIVTMPGTVEAERIVASAPEMPATGTPIGATPTS
jgi:hypothetical protein